ncbi:MAG: tetratricopeptide repeat protein [Bradyrhizobium sp.]|nr:tetratricopeptide repeat protein [Bradyrhizobium sp.]
MQAGRPLDAQHCCLQALAADPGCAEAMHLMGLLFLQAGQYDHAIEWVARANRHDPDTDYLFGLGTALELQGRHQEAFKAFDQAVQLKPADAEFRSSRGTALHRLGRFDEAVADNLQAHALDPASPYICNNIGAALQLLRRDEEALPWFDKALALKADFIMALINKASSLAQMRRIEEAIEAYSRVKAIDPANMEAQAYLSLIHLLTGDFEAAWAGYRARWNAHTAPKSRPDFHRNLWLGRENVAGKTILVFADEGLGDTIQFARYIPMLAARGAKIILQAEEALHPLLAGLEGVAHCLGKSAPSLPPFDLHCPITTLPLAFGTRLETIPGAGAYLPPPAPTRVQAWERRLRQAQGAGRRLRVGLVWSGNSRHSNDHNRSIPLRALLRLLEAEASFVSLQKEAAADDTSLLRARGIIELTSGLTDFAETAALVNCLDLVVSVDTSVAHLAAALGRPTWILLPYLPDHRWLLDRDDSPWYPTARLFRQSARRDWAEVIDQVRAALDAQISISRPA